MRPTSIVWFERLCLIFMVSSEIYSRIHLAPSSNLSGATSGTGLFIIKQISGPVILLLLLFFAARRGSNIAKWIWVVLIGFSLAGWVLVVLLGFASVVAASMTSAAKGILLVNIVSQIASIIMLFRPDAKAWFANRGR